MTPEATLEEQVRRYRLMTGQERLAVALDLHDFACDLAREGIRRQHPGASPAAVEQLLRERLALATRS